MFQRLQKINVLAATALAIAYLLTATPLTVLAMPAPSEWAAEAVEETQALGIATPDLLYDYTAPTTRLEFCRAAVNFLRQYGYGPDVVEPATFSDTDDRDAGTAATLGIAQGTDEVNNLFSPDAPLTREQAAAMLDNTLSLIEDQPRSESVGWADVDEISDWALQAVNSMHSLGIINGTNYAEPVFSPKAVLTHEQSIVMLYRMWEHVCPEVIVLAPEIVPKAENSPIPSRWCESAEEGEKWIAENIINQTEVFELSYPTSIPAEVMGSNALLHGGELRCEDYIRWWRKSTKITRDFLDEKTVYRYTMTYTTTPAQNTTASIYADGIVKLLGTENMSERGKVDAICDFAEKHLKYDHSLKSVSAYSTFVEGKGTCMGLSMAIQLMLKKAGIESKTISGMNDDKRHMWLMVRIDGYWYRVETTRISAGYLEPAIDGGAYFAEAEYRTEEFVRAHPVKVGV